MLYRIKKIIQSLGSYFNKEIFYHSLYSSLVFNLLYNSFIINSRLNYYEHNISTYLDFFCNFIIMFIFTALLFYSLSFSKIIYSLVKVFLFLASTGAAYYLYNHKINLSYDLVKSVLYTTNTEAQELMSFKLIGFLLFSFIIATFLIIKNNKIQRKIKQRISAFLVFLLTFLFLIRTPLISLFIIYYPTNYLGYINNHVIEHFRHINKVDISLGKFTNNSKGDLQVIFVIGEASRGDHFSLNGYKRETNPLLKEEKNLFSFQNFKSCATMTHASLPCMMGRICSPDRLENLKETTFLSIYRKNNFSVKWASTQNLRQQYNKNHFYSETDFLFLPEGAVSILPYDLDEKLLPFLDKFLSKSERNLIILHTSGSHNSYDRRYSQAFKKFTPICGGKNKEDISQCKKEHLINSYDNTILYTDFFLSEVIKNLKDKNAIMIYVSDHGESLGEDGVYFHGGTSPEQFLVPFIVWMSDMYIKNNPEKYQALQRNLKNNLEQGINFDYKNIFHTILDAASIEGEVIDKKKSMCR